VASNSRSGQSPSRDQIARQAARRVAAATRRITEAKSRGSKDTIEAIRVSLLSAAKIHPHQTVTDDVADYALARIRELYEAEAGL
jgi:hypothetical protein